MKNNPKRHKAQNTFRFQTFSDRIAEIDIDIFHKVKHPFEEDDEVPSTYFSQCLKKWNNESFAPHFIELKKKLPLDISLPQLIVQKEEIVEILIAHLKNCDIDSLQPALELVTALAKDLRKEFFPLFCPFVLRECIILLDTREPEQIEWVFTCLAHQFKFLWSAIIKNINNVLCELLPLLSNRKPQYINNFAAESFAFVARKVKDKKQFLLCCLKNVKNSHEELAGIARLLFETIKSVGNQFHSNAQEFLVILLNELSNQKCSDTVYTICDNLITYIISFVTLKTNVIPLWNSIMTVARQLYAVWLDNHEDQSAKILTMLLKFIKRLVTCKEIILREPENLMNFMLTFSIDKNIEKFFDFHVAVVDIISQLLISPNYSSNLLNYEEIILKVFSNIESGDLAIHFTENIISVSKYESLVFREFLKFIDNHTLDEKCLNFLAKVIWMKNGLAFPRNDEHLKFYSTNFESVSDTVLENLRGKISTPVSYETSEFALNVIIVNCNIKHRRVSITKTVDKILKELCEKIDSCSSVEHIAKFLYVLLISFQSRISYDVETPFNYSYLVNLTAKFIDSSNYLCSLRILDLISSLREKYFSKSKSSINICKYLNSPNIKVKLINNLSSPFHKVRLFTLHVLTKMNIHPVFEDLYLIETVEPSVQSYRDKLQKLQNLEFNEKFAGEVTDDVVRSAVLKFLFGNLYINFQYMWEPLQKLIASHLENSDNAWTELENQISNSEDDNVLSEKLLKNFVIDFKCDFLQKHFYEQNGVDDRPDFYNYRCLVLSMLTNLKEYRFKVEHCLCNLFLRFYKSEYAINSQDFSSSCSIRKLEDDEPDESMNESTFHSDAIEKEMKNNKNLNKLFVILLKLINNISHEIPQKQKEEFNNIHFELLTNGNSDIQQAAVNYICKSRRMSHYKSRLISLTKEDSFKSELLNFKIDLNSDVILERDREYLMKIILRILYEKIRKKTGHQLRDFVFEFLAGCDETYMIVFFDMLFKKFKPYVENLMDPILYFKEEVDLENILSPSCFLTYVTLALDLQKRCGKLLNHSCLSYLLRVILKTASVVALLLNARNNVHTGYYGIISKTRIVSFEAIIYFFENFEYKWKENELKAVVQYFIEPWIEKMEHECLQSPNPVMKLFIVFTHNMRYFPLLAHKCGNLTPLDALMNLLISEKSYFNVKNSILEAVERLLTIEEEDENEFISDLKYMNSNFQTNRQYGTQLLLPYVSIILAYIEKSLTKKYVKLNGIYMLILKRISEFGLDEKTSIVLLNLLIPILESKATADEDVVMPLLETIFNLFKKIENYDLFEGYLLQIAHLFNIAMASPVRRALRDIVAHIGEKTGTKFVNAGIVQGLNLFDSRALDQPDYAGRLETYKCINEASEKNELNLYTGVFIIYNTFHTLKNERDIALRDHSGLCLRRICPVLARKFEKSSREFNIILNDTLLPLIKDGIRGQNENYQYESVMLLGHMVRECPTLHPIFKDLYVLADTEDLENDFFENIQHIQLHRRTKALKRFIEIMSQQMKSPQPYSLTFLYPLISRFLLCEKINETGLIHASIEALKIMCHFSPWHHYERILKQYVMEIRKHVSLRKQGIRIIAAILDSFHFDISAADEEFAEPKSTKINRQNVRKGKLTLEEPMEVDTPIENAEEDGSGLKISEPCVKRVSVLCRSDAVRVYKCIKSFLVPSLNRIFMTYEDSDQFHKVNKKTAKNNKEELAVLSIPIAYATVKLLKRLPRTLLDQYIPSVFLKLSTYLKSRLMSIRLVARETMQNILMDIGPSYFPKLLSEMMSILTKGFQIHVLVFTCHAILEKIQSLFTIGQIDLCINPILEICIVDLFGKLAEEKTIAQISSKTPEAKGNKSYNMLTILAEYIGENHILDLVLPLKEILANNMSSKVVGKVSRCLKYIALGLTKNQFLSPESLLAFSYGVSNDCIPTLVMERENNKVKVGNDKCAERVDSFIIPEEPRFITAEKRKVCSRTNAHVIIEFGLELLESMLKREIIRSESYRPRLDPFILVITDCVQSQYNKLVILALKCLIYLLRRDLPSLNKNVSVICETVFTILSKYSTSIVSGENGELVMCAAKVALVLIRDVKHLIDNDQVKILLYVTEDLQRSISHYGTGFALLKAILRRKYNIPEVHEVMRKTAELSITSYNDSVRFMARKAYYHYLVNYPHGQKKLREKVQFIAAQLRYEEEPGRKSALEFLMVLTNAFPKEELVNLSSLLFFKLTCRLIEDDSAECKKMAAECIAMMIRRIQDTKEEQELLDATMNWFEEKKIPCRIAAIQVLGIFITEKNVKFAPKLDEILPVIENQFFPQKANSVGKYVKAPSSNEIDHPEGETDGLIFHLLQLYKKIMETLPTMLENEKYVNHVQRVADNCQALLKHSHEWVRLGATQILGLIFKSLDISKIADVLLKKKQPRKFGFLVDGQARTQIKALCLDLCDQLVPAYDVMEQLLKQTMKDLLFLAEVLQYSPCVETKKLSLPWLVNKLMIKIRKEVVHSPQKYVVRTMVFNWLAALAVKLDADKLTPLLNIILSPILRELSTADDRGVEIRRMAKEVLKYYRKKVNADVYDKSVILIQRKLDSKRVQRKVKISRMAVTEPERASRRKMKIQQKKKEQRKRRLEALRKRKFKSGKRKLAVIAE